LKKKSKIFQKNDDKSKKKTTFAASKFETQIEKNRRFKIKEKSS
jgi:hypothetical protein